jgi:hypothetical protein
VESRGQILTPEGLAALSVAQLHVWPATASEEILPLAPEVPVKVPFIKSEAQQEVKVSAAKDQKMHVPTTVISKVSKEISGSASVVKATASKQALSISSVKDTVPQRGITPSTVPAPVTKGVLGLGGRSAYLCKVPRVSKPVDGSANQPITIAEASISHKNNICSVTSTNQSVKELKVEHEILSDANVKPEPGSVQEKNVAQEHDQKIKSEQGGEKLAPLSPTDRNLSAGRTALPKRSLGELPPSTDIDLIS